MFCLFSQLHRKRLNPAIYQYPTCRINLFRPTVAFHIETSHFICSVNQVTCFNMKCNTWLRWVKIFSCQNIVKHFEWGKTRLLHDINSYRSINATCINFDLLQVSLFFKNFITYCGWLYCQAHDTFVCKNVNTVNAKFRNECMNCILLFFSVTDEVQSSSN